MRNKIGIGFRRDLAEDFLNTEDLKVDFVEFAPENWIGMGGYWHKIIERIAERYPIFLHGLSLSIGSPEDLDWEFLAEVKKFMKRYDIKIYSEHLSYTKSGNAHLYDLLPIPFRYDAVKHIAERIRKVQDFLGQRIVIENVSYYTAVEAEMSEEDFIKTIVNEADCRMLLDVNNVYVNAFNHNYNAEQFIDALPLDKVEYIHMAGHTKVSETLIIDSHGEDIIDPVYELFDYTAKRIKPVPVLLERDFNIPILSHLNKEIINLRKIMQKYRTQYAN